MAGTETRTGRIDWQRTDFSGTGHWFTPQCRIEGVACSYTYASSCMSLTVATIVNSALSFVSAACRAMLQCLVKWILLTFLVSFWSWTGMVMGPRWASRASRDGLALMPGSSVGQEPHDKELSLILARCSLRLFSSH
jgi:hypothetical protein